MADRDWNPAGVTPAQERWLTFAGLVACAVIVFFGFRCDILAGWISANGIFLVFIVLGGVMLFILALYGLMNSFRLLTRGGRKRRSDYVDLGWGGQALGHYTEADEDDLCGIGRGGD
ncbi:hypothetical protein JW859_00545 [bacterium]|nr:hypothetical protein [bacterium]